jgi:nucleoside phosphorylase
MAQKTRYSHRKQIAARRWLVLSAWSPELSELRRLLASKAKSSTVVEACGVGLVEAAMGAALAIARERPDAVLFVGTAGRYKNRLPGLALGDVVAARELHLWSEDVTRGSAYFPAPLPITLKTTSALRRRAVALGLPEADVACPLGITTHSPQNSGPDVENLEAFAVGRAAARQGLPFMAILGISNLVGPSAHAQWKKHARAAAAAACQAAHALIAESRRPFHSTARGQ